MNDPRMEDGYTPIANEILEQLAMVKLNDTQHRIILVVWRMTYGWQRAECKLSNSYLTEALQVDQRIIRREFQRLVDRKIIKVIKNAIGSSARIVEFNKHYDEWQGWTKTTSDKKVRTQKTPIEGTKIPHERTILTPIEWTNESTNKEIKKYIKKKERMPFDVKSVFDHYQTLNLINHRSYTKEMQQAIISAMKNNQYDIEYCKTLLDRHKAVVEMTKDSEYQVKPRSLQEFFGQKVFNAKHLICSEYDEGGKYYEKYLKGDREEKIDISSFEMVYVDG